jgi:hypothetical protein
MHGTEVVGTIAISRLLRELDSNDVRGTIIGVPVLNVWAFESEHRLTTLIDHFDLERLFPGDEQGSISERIAYGFMNEFARHADCLIDFHGQDQYWQPTRAIILPKPKPQGNVDPAAYEKCVDAARAFGVRQIWRVNKPGSVTEAVMKERVIPAISPEFGGTTDFKNFGQYVGEAMEGIRNVMKWLGMLGGDVASRDYRTCVCDLHPVCNRFGGVWSTHMEVEREVEAGSVVGTVSDPITAEIVEEIRAPFSGVITNLWCSPVIKPAVLAFGLGKVIDYV